MAKKRNAKPSRTQRKRNPSSDQIYELEIFLAETARESGDGSRSAAT